MYNFKWSVSYYRFDSNDSSEIESLHARVKTLEAGQANWTEMVRGLIDLVKSGGAEKEEDKVSKTWILQAYWHFKNVLSCF